MKNLSVFLISLIIFIIASLLLLNYLNNDDRKYKKILSEHNLQENNQAKFEILYKTKNGFIPDFSTDIKKVEDKYLKELNFTTITCSEKSVTFKNVEQKYVLIDICEMYSAGMGSYQGEELKNIYVVDDTAYIIFKKAEKIKSNTFKLNSKGMYTVQGKSNYLIRFGIKINKDLKEFKIINY